MKLFLIVALVATVFCFPFIGSAQEELPPPADWGELAERLVDNWGLGLAAEPSGGDPSVNALNLIGIGKDSYQIITGIESDDVFPADVDGYDPENWPPEQELTEEFMCKLKVVVWAAAYSGLIPYYDVPRPANPGETLTPEEEKIANEVAREAVLDLLKIAKRDGACESGGDGAPGGGGGGGLCWVCTGGTVRIPVCGWAPCP